MDWFRGKKKLKMSILGIAAVIVTNYVPEVDQESVILIVLLIVSYIFGQGMADFGKERVNGQ